MTENTDQQANTLMLFTDAHISWAAKKGDDALPFDEWIKNKLIGGAVELGDGPAIKLILNGVNKLASPKVPDTLKDNLHIALDDCIDGDHNYLEAIDQIDQVGKEILDITKLPLKTQKVILMGLNMLEFILAYLDEKDSPVEPAEERN